ncbi:hypothetical protein ACP4OV_020946 [Aristida adscensionis]
MGFVGAPSRARAREQEAAPLTSRRSSHPPAAEAPNPRPTPTAANAFMYVDAIRREFIFSGQRHKYDEFLNILRDFRDGRSNTRAVVDRMTVLLDGHPNLAAGFNAYLPVGLEIRVPQQQGGGAPPPPSN